MMVVVEVSARALAACRVFACARITADAIVVAEILLLVTKVLSALLSLVMPLSLLILSLVAELVGLLVGLSLPSMLCLSLSLSSVLELGLGFRLESNCWELGFLLLLEVPLEFNWCCELVVASFDLSLGLASVATSFSVLDDVSRLLAC